MSRKEKKMVKKSTLMIFVSHENSVKVFPLKKILIIDYRTYKIKWEIPVIFVIF